MTGGHSPVCVPEIMHALATCHSGMRPVPVSDSSPEMRAAPVVIRLCINGRVIELAPHSWAMVPHAAEKIEDDKGPAAPEQLARLVFNVRLPADALAPIVAGPKPAEEPSDFDAIQGIGPRVIPEQKDTDPGVFTVNHDKVMQSLADLYERGRAFYRGDTAVANKAAE